MRLVTWKVAEKKLSDTVCSLIIVFFPYIFGIFLNSASSAAALVFYLPCECTHTDTEGKQRKAKSSKNTIFNEHPVHKMIQYNEISLSDKEFIGARICMSKLLMI